MSVGLFKWFACFDGNFQLPRFTFYLFRPRQLCVYTCSKFLFGDFLPSVLLFIVPPDGWSAQSNKDNRFLQSFIHFYSFSTRNSCTLSPCHTPPLSSELQTLLIITSFSILILSTSTNIITYIHTT